MRATAYVVMIIFSIIGSACGVGTSTPSSQAGVPQNLRVLVHDSFAINVSLVEGFEKEQNVKLEFIKAGDAGSVLNKALLTKDNPLADVIYGIDLVAGHNHFNSTRCPGQNLMPVVAYLNNEYGGEIP